MKHVHYSKEDYLYIYADCIIIKGYTRTMILDIGRRNFFFVDNCYYDLLMALKEDSIKQVESYLETAFEREQYILFLNYLIKNELAYVVNDLKLFPPIDERWDDPTTIVNAIIDFREINHDVGKICQELNSLGCKYLQIRCYKQISITEISKWLNLVKYNTEVRSVQLLISYHEEFTSVTNILKLLKEFPTCLITVHSSPHDKALYPERDGNAERFMVDLGFALYIKQEINSCESCGIINESSFFIPSLEGFMESKLYNSCLNRKISIDEHGNIKNCPSMKISYGKISETSLTEVCQNSDFSKHFNIKKDDIAVCKDCEFRYLCTDCRAYRTEEHNLYSKPSKCMYDPYAGSWSQRNMVV